MRKPSYFRVLTALITLFAALQILMSPGPAFAAPSSPAYGIVESFPERKTSSYEAGRFLSYLAGQLQQEGWSTRILPYTNVTKTASDLDRSIVYARVSGENLLALQSPDARSLDYLIISPYDNLFPDSPQDPSTWSATAVSTSLALELAHRLDRDPLKLGMAFVSGHYQNGAGLWALMDVLEEEGITAGAFLVLGDLQAYGRLPLVAGAETPISFVERLVEAAETAGLQPVIATYRTLHLLAGRSRLLGGLSPEKPLPLGAGFQGEHGILEDLGVPVVTVGLPFSDPTVRSRSAAAPAVSVGDTVSAVAEALTSALGTPPPPEGPVAGEMPVLSVLGETRFVPGSVALGAGLGLAAVLLAIALSRLPKDLSAFALCAGTCAAAALSMVLHSLFSNRSAVRYASDVLPGRSIILVFVIFALLVLSAFLRLWSIRSRIHHVHEISRAGTRPPDEKSVWGSAWGLAVLATLIGAASYTQSEMLPSLALAGVAHGAGTLILKPQGEGQAPSLYALWSARLLYLAPLLAVFWAGNPFAQWTQALYRASWTSLNWGSMISALSLGVTAASVLGTLRMPGPVARKAFLPLALCEVAALALVLISGLLVPTPYSPRIPAWAVAEESYGFEARLVFSSPVPIHRVTMVQSHGDPSDYESLAGFQYIDLDDTVKFDWAHPARTRYKGDEKKAEDDTEEQVKLAASFGLMQYADAVSVEFFEPELPRTHPKGFRIHGLDTLLGCSPEELGGETSLHVPPRYSVSIVWWDTVHLPDSLPYGVEPYGMARVTHKMQALYLDRSYAGISPVTEGIRYYRITSRVLQYTGL